MATTKKVKTTQKTNQAICDNCGEPHPVAKNPNASRDCQDPDDPTDPGHYLMTGHKFPGSNDLCNGSGLCPMTTSWVEK